MNRLLCPSVFFPCVHREPTNRILHPAPEMAAAPELGCSERVCVLSLTPPFLSFRPRPCRSCSTWTAGTLQPSTWPRSWCSSTKVSQHICTWSWSPWKLWDQKSAQTSRSRWGKKSSSKSFISWSKATRHSVNIVWHCRHSHVFRTIRQKKHKSSSLLTAVDLKSSADISKSFRLFQFQSKDGHSSFCALGRKQTLSAAGWRSKVTETGLLRRVTGCQVLVLCLEYRDYPPIPAW